MSLLRASFTVGFMTLLSRILGFVRDMMVASVMGAGMLSDAFLVAFKIPNFMRRIFAEGAFNSAFVPLYAGTQAEEGASVARQFAEDVHAVLLLTLVVVTSLMIIFMPWLMYILAPGFTVDPGKYNLTVTLTRITMPYIIFISLVSLLGGILNSLNKFAAVAATPILMNLTFIFSLLALNRYSETPAHALAYGVFTAGVVQYLWLVWFAKKADALPKLVRPRVTENVRKLFRLIIPAALGAGVAQVNLLIDVIIASMIPGAVSYLYYADRIAEFPLGVVGIAVATALLPMMSRLIREGKSEHATHHQNRAIELSLLLGLPSAAACIALAFPIISVVFERGEFDRDDALFTYPALIAFSLGLPAFLLVKIFATTFYANRDTKTPVKIAIVCLVTNFVLNILSLLTLRETGYAHVGMAGSTAFAGWVNAACLGISLRRQNLLVADEMLKVRLPRLFVATLIMTACVLWLDFVLADYIASGDWHRYAALAAYITAGMGSYAIAVLGLQVVTPMTLKGYFRRGSR